MMLFTEARERLLGNGYQMVPVAGEPLWMVFWPPDRDGKRRVEALDERAIIAMAMRLPMPGEVKGKPVVDVDKVGIVGRLVKVPMTTSAEGDPKLQIVLEVDGRSAVDTVPIERLRDMLGQLILLQLNQVQIRFNWESDRNRQGA
ncbi:MAG: hypothetical protein ACOY93_08555 [Bacillota bacterium]